MSVIAASDSDSPPPKKRVKKGTSKKSKTKSKRHRDNFTFASYVPERVYKAAQSSGAAMKTITVIDGGSTCSITTSFEDCKDIEPCSEHIMVGGKKGSNRLKCKWKGTRVLKQKDLRGEVQKIEVRNTKIMPGFGVKVLPEHIFLRRGCRIIKDEVGDALSMEVQHRKTKQVLMRAEMHHSGLFFLGNGARSAFGEHAHTSLATPPGYSDYDADYESDDTAANASSDDAESENEYAAANASSEGAESDDDYATANASSEDAESDDDYAAANASSDSTSENDYAVENASSDEAESGCAAGHETTAEGCCCGTASDSEECTESESEESCIEERCHVARRYNSARTNEEILLLWHKKLGHRNTSDIYIVRLLNSWGIPVKHPSKPIYCEACIQGKSTKKPTPYSLPPRERAPRRGYMLHSDTCGPFTMPTRGSGAKYFNIIVDDYSGRIWLRLLNSLSGTEFHKHLQDVLNEIEAEVGSTRVVARFHSDGARYFTDHRIKDLLQQRGGRFTTSPPYTPNKNAVAERTIRTVCEMARTMMIDANAPASLWGEAITYAVYLLNNLPYLAGEAATRMSLWHGKAPPTRPNWRFIPWGTVVWAHIHHENDLRGKAISNAKARKCVFLGVDEQSSSLRLGAMPHLRLVQSAHVVSKEDKYAWASAEHDEPALERTEFLIDNRQCEQGAALDDDELAEEAGGGLAITRERRAWTPSAAALQNLASSKPIAPSYGDKALVTMFAVSNLAFITELEPEPKTWREAMRTKDRDDWVASGKSEFESQASNGTWGNLMAVQELKRSDPGVRIIAAGDVLKAKRDGRKKTRTVLRGYMMEPGIHFNETFAPVVHITTLRVLIALGTKLDWEMKQGDVPTAFQQSDIDTDIWAYPSEAYRHLSSARRCRPYAWSASTARAKWRSRWRRACLGYRKALICGTCICTNSWSS